MPELLELVSEKHLMPADDRTKYQRTEWMYLQNDTPLSIEICFFQATSRYNLPKPYQKDTGVFVGGVNGKPGASIGVDPWDAGGRNRPIAGTAGHCTVKIRDAKGKTRDVPLNPFPECPDGQYRRQMGWRIYVGQVHALEGGVVNTVCGTALVGTARLHIDQYTD